MLKNKALLITGSTGSFGNAVLQRFLHTDQNNFLNLWVLMTITHCR